MSTETNAMIADRELMQDYKNCLSVYKRGLCYEECTALLLKSAMYDAKNQKDYELFKKKTQELYNQMHVVDQAQARCTFYEKLIQIQEKRMNPQYFQTG